MDLQLCEAGEVTVIGDITIAGGAILGPGKFNIEGTLTILPEEV